MYTHRLIFKLAPIHSLMDTCNRTRVRLVSTSELHEILSELGLVQSEEQTSQWIEDADQGECVI